MDIRQERYWLLRQGLGVPVPGERQAEDFVHCEVLVGEETGMALEVFTSRRNAEAELRSMKRLAPGKYREPFEEPDEALLDKVVELLPEELVEVLRRSNLPYVLVDPPPLDEPIPGGLRIEPAPLFVRGLTPGRRSWAGRRDQLLRNGEARPSLPGGTPGSSGEPGPGGPCSGTKLLQPPVFLVAYRVAGGRRLERRGRV